MIEYGVSARIPSSARGQNVLASPAQRASGEDAEQGEAAARGSPGAAGGERRHGQTFPVEQTGHRQSCRLCFLVSGFLDWVQKRAHGKIIMWKHVRVSWHLIRCRIPSARSGRAGWQRRTEVAGTRSPCAALGMNARWHTLCSVRLPAPLGAGESHCAHLAARRLHLAALAAAAAAPSLLCRN